MVVVDSCLHRTENSSSAHAEQHNQRKEETAILFLAQRTESIDQSDGSSFQCRKFTDDATENQGEHNDYHIIEFHDIEDPNTEGA